MNTINAPRAQPAVASQSSLTTVMLGDAAPMKEPFAVKTTTVAVHVTIPSTMLEPALAQS